MDEIRGLYNALLVRHDLPAQSVAAPHAWRVQGDDRFALAIRREAIEAYAARRSTRVDRMMTTWEAAGLARVAPVQVQRGREPVRVYLLTHEAVRDDRVAPNLRDKMTAWPELTANALHSTGTRICPAPQSARGPQGPLGMRRSIAERSNDPHVVLKAIVRWAEEYRATLLSPGANPVGQWEATVGDTAVLLVRSSVAMQLLGTYAADSRTVQHAWRDAGIIVTSGFESDERENRFTVGVRTNGGMSALRYLAFAWTALEQAGLRRGDSNATPVR